MISSEVQSAIAINLTQLQSLTFSLNFRKSPAMFPDLAFLSNLKKLKELNITGGTLQTFDWNNEIMSRLGILKLPYTWTEINTGLESIKMALRLEFASVSDHILRLIATSCPYLLELKVGYSEKITQSGVQAVIDGCPRLKRFGLQDRRKD